MERPTSLRVGDKLTIEHGLVVTALKKPSRRTSPGHTALHEAAHIEVAGVIQWATIIPSSTYQGATMPASMTAASAMAAAALGMEGTGWDEFLTEHILGVDPHSAKNAALSALSGRYDYMEAVAEELEEKGTIGQADVEIAHEKVQRRRRGVWNVQVQVVEPDGKVEEFDAESEGDTILIRDEWITIASQEKKMDKKEEG